jgi:nickel transport protein
MDNFILNNRVSGIQIFIAVTSLLVFILTADTVCAHKVIVFGYIDGDTVHTESKFSSGKKAQNSRITVYDSQGEKLAEGITDSDGAFAFKPPFKTTLKIVLDAGAGHRAEWVIPKTEFDEAQSVHPLSENHLRIKTVVESSESFPIAPAFTLDDVRTVVAVELEKKIKPVRLILMENQNSGPSLQDILGGIGYIFGLMGIAAYFHSKKPKD